MNDYSHITQDALISEVKAVAEENPDFVYAAPKGQSARSEGVDGLLDESACYYVHTDEDDANPQCGCIMSHALNRLGVPLDVLRQHEGTGIGSLLDSLNIDTSDHVAGALIAVQMGQDSGLRWTTAVADADI